MAGVLCVFVTAPVPVWEHINLQVHDWYLVRNGYGRIEPRGSSTFSFRVLANHVMGMTLHEALDQFWNNYPAMSPPQGVTLNGTLDRMWC